MGTKGWDIAAAASVTARNSPPLQPQLPIGRRVVVVDVPAPSPALPPLDIPYRCLPAPASMVPWRWEGDILHVRLAIKTKNMQNASSPQAKFAEVRYRKDIRKAVKLSLMVVSPRWTTLPVEVTLIRHSAGHLDQHDGIGPALKSVVDEIAEFLPLPKKPHAVRIKGQLVRTMRADDSDPSVTWKYEQVKVKPGLGWVDLRFAARKDAT